jgi:alpha-tubulin suppressor-like RCC1 family protein
VSCWGESGDGELGNGKFGNDSPPVPVMGLANVTAIAAGDSFTCAAAPSGAYCWGYDIAGELGDGGGASHAVPQLVPGVAPLVPTMIAAGSIHACAAAATGAFCWGAGGSGQLGNAAKPTMSTAVAVTGAGSGATWTPSRLAAGGDHTCAVDTTGKVRCWGENGTGAIGDGTSTDRSSPTQLASLGATVVDVVAGDASTCAQTTNGPRCWGYNFYGQLGDGTTTDHKTPTAVASLVTAAQPATGTSHSCALSSGEVDCWGDNSLGQLGNGTFSVAMTPVEVAFP